MAEFNLEEKNYYQRLFVERTATKQEIIDAYRQLARILHPDSDALEPNDEHISAEHDKMFTLITEAYNVLTNEKERLKYDQTLPPDLRGWDTPGKENAEDLLARKFEERKKSGLGATVGDTQVSAGLNLIALREKMIRQQMEAATKQPRERKPSFGKKIFQE